MRKLTLAVALPGLVLSASLASPAAAQGLFDSLFGGLRRVLPPSEPYPYPGEDMEDFRGRGGRPSPPGSVPIPSLDDLSRNRIATKPPPYVPPEVVAGPLGRFVRDPTLRRGDVVATASGLMVYRGAGGSWHDPRDFVPLSGGRDLVQGKASQLAAMDKAMKRDDSSGAAPAVTAPIGPEIRAER